MIRRLTIALLLTISAAQAVPATAPVPAKEVLPFIADDYAKALTMARKSHLPIFMEAWAPW